MEDERQDGDQRGDGDEEYGRRFSSFECCMVPPFRVSPLEFMKRPAEQGGLTRSFEL